MCRGRGGGGGVESLLGEAAQLPRDIVVTGEPEITGEPGQRNESPERLG